MSMPNGNHVPLPSQPPPRPQPIVRGQHVTSGPMTFSVDAGYAQGAKSQRMVKLHVEHTTGSTELIMAADFAVAMAKSLLAAGSGLQTAGG